MPVHEWVKERSQYGYGEWILQITFSQWAAVSEHDASSGGGSSRGYERSETTTKVYYALVNNKTMKLEGFRSANDAMQACEERLLMDAKAVVDFLKKRRER